METHLPPNDPRNYNTIDDEKEPHSRPHNTTIEVNMENTSSSQRRQKVKQILENFRERINDEQMKRNQKIYEEIEKISEDFGKKVSFKQLKEGEHPSEILKNNSPNHNADNNNATTNTFGDVSQFIFSPSKEIIESLGFKNLKRHPNFNISRKSTEHFESSTTVMNNFMIFMHTTPVFVSLVTFQPVAKYMDTVSLVTLLDNIITEVCKKSVGLNTFYFRIDEFARAFRSIIKKISKDIKGKKDFSQFLKKSFSVLSVKKAKDEENSVDQHQAVEKTQGLMFSDEESENNFWRKVQDLEFSSDILTGLTYVDSESLTSINEYRRKLWKNKHSTPTKKKKLFVEDIIDQFHIVRADILNRIRNFSRRAIEFPMNTDFFKQFTLQMAAFADEIVNTYSFVILRLYRNCSDFSDDMEVALKNVELNSNPESAITSKGNPEVSLGYSKIISHTEVTDESAVKFIRHTLGKMRSVQYFCQLRQNENWDERTLDFIQEEKGFDNVWEPNEAYIINLCNWFVMDVVERFKKLYENRFLLFYSKVDSMEVEKPERIKEKITNRLTDYMLTDREKLPSLDLA